jgi:hypothetical protein
VQEPVKPLEPKTRRQHKQVDDEAEVKQVVTIPIEVLNRSQVSQAPNRSEVDGPEFELDISSSQEELQRLEEEERKIDKKRPLTDYERFEPQSKKTPEGDMTKLQHEIQKINAIDRLKDQQEKRLNKFNRAVKSFDEVQVDFMV